LSWNCPNAARGALAPSHHAKTKNFKRTHRIHSWSRQTECRSLALELPHEILPPSRQGAPSIRVRRDPKSAEHRGGEAGLRCKHHFERSRRALPAVFSDVRDITRQFVKARRRAALFFAARQSTCWGARGAMSSFCKTLFAGLLALFLFPGCGPHCRPFPNGRSALNVT